MSQRAHLQPRGAVRVVPPPKRRRRAAEGEQAQCTDTPWQGAEPCLAARVASGLQDNDLLEGLRAPARIGPPGSDGRLADDALEPALDAADPMLVRTQALADDLAGQLHLRAPVTVVLGGRAERELAGGSAQGMARGGEVLLRAARFDPRTAQGRRLLAHELVHAAQQQAHEQSPAQPSSPELAEHEAATLAEAYVRGQALALPQQALLPATAACDDGERAREDEILKTPVTYAVSVGYSGIQFTPKPATQRWAGNIDRRLQFWAAQIKALTGKAYSVTLARETRAWLEANGGIEWINVPQRPAAQDEAVDNGHMQVVLANKLIRYLTTVRQPPVPLTLSAEQIQTLRTVEEMEVVFERVKVHGNPPGTFFWHAWYDIGIFKRVMFANKDFWQQLRDAGEDQDKLDAASQRYLTALMPYEYALSAVRGDPELTDVDGYRALWNMPAKAAGDTSKTAPVDKDSVPNLNLAGEFLLDTQAHHSLAAIQAVQPNAEYRRKLFKDWALRMRLRKVDLEGDVSLRDAPLKAVQPPDRAALIAYPALEPPYYDRQVGSEMTFKMSVYTANMWEHWIPWHYKFEVIQVPHDDWSQRDAVGQNMALQGEDYGGFGSLLGSRVKRNLSNAQADVRRTLLRVENILGPPGLGPATLAGGSAVLSVVGSVIKTVFQKLTERDWEYTAAIGKEGVYVVRCTATRRDRDSAVIHKMPSAAYLPIWVRSPEDMASDRVKLDKVMTEFSQSRLDDLRAKLKADRDGSVPLDPAERTRLEDEARDLTTALYGNAEGQLQSEKRKLAAIKADSPEWGRMSAADQKALNGRLSDIDFILDKRSGWIQEFGDATLGVPERLEAYFVTQEGPSANRPMKLLLEVVPLRASRGKLRYAVFDNTTRHGEHREGPERDTRADAICDAIVELLEDVGYGRGKVTLAIPVGIWDIGAKRGEVRTLTIQRSNKELFFEGLENAALVASIALIAAAPFTGGASLALLLPVGVIGAIPSAYRLIHRASEGNFEWDMAAVMDIMNCVGAAVGLGHFATSLKLVNVSQRVWMIVGMGMDGLQGLVGGADLLNQLAALKDVEPEGMRMAMAMQIVGNAILQLGIAIGGRLAADGLAKKQALEAGVGIEANPNIVRAGAELARPMVDAGLADVPVLVNTGLDDNSVRVRFTPDGYGMPSDIHVVAGKHASVKQIELHVQTVQLLQKYSGLGGWIRSLWDRVNALVYSKQYTQPGSRGWVAKAEITKIKGIVEHYSQEIADGKVSAIDGQAYLDYLKRELRRHEQAINEIEDGPGFIAAMAPVGADAVKHGYPMAPEGHYYVEESPGVFQLRAHVGYTGQAKMAKPMAGGGWEVVDRPTDAAVVAPGTPLPASAKEPPKLDMAQLRADVARALGVPGSTLEIVATPAGDTQVRLQPPAETGGKYRLAVPADATTTAVEKVVRRHEELRSLRPADITRAAGDGSGRSKWTGALEAEYRGRPTEEGYHWRLKDGRLEYVTEAVDEGQQARPKRVWNEQTGRLENDPLVREAKRFADTPEMTPTLAFDELGGTNPQSPFGKWVAFMESMGFRRADMVSEMHAKPGGLTHDTVRHALKAQTKYSDAIRKWLIDPDTLRARYPDEFRGVKPADSAAADAALAKARHRAALEIDQHLPLKDASNWTERWYIDVFGTRAGPGGAAVTKVETQVMLSKDLLNQKGIPVQDTRNADLLVETRAPDPRGSDPAGQQRNYIKDVKSHEGPISAADKAQFADFKLTINKEVPRTDGSTVRIDGVTEVFLDPKGVIANAEWMADKLNEDGAGGVRFEVFNGKGVPKVFGAGDAQRLGSKAALMAAIEAHARS
jgi:hypothetical protein